METEQVQVEQPVEQEPVNVRTRLRPVLPGQVSLFRGKVRMPISVTLTPDHHAKVRRNMKRLGLTRADLIGLLIEMHADTVKL